MPPFLSQHWMIFVLIFFAILVYGVINRRLQRQWIGRRFGADQVRMLSFGVTYLGCRSQPGKPIRSSGFLLFTPQELFFRGRSPAQELRIPGDYIQGVYHDTVHKGRELHHSVMKIDFANPQKGPDCAAFKVPYPPQWITALQAAFPRKEDRPATPENLR